MGMRYCNDQAMLLTIVVKHIPVQYIAYYNFCLHFTEVSFTKITLFGLLTTWTNVLNFVTDLRNKIFFQYPFYTIGSCKTSYWRYSLTFWWLTVKV